MKFSNLLQISLVLINYKKQQCMYNKVSEKQKKGYLVPCIDFYNETNTVCTLHTTQRRGYFSSMSSIEVYFSFCIATLKLILNDQSKTTPGKSVSSSYVGFQLVSVSI